MVIVIISMTHMQNCLSDVVKSINIKVFNLMSETNEARHIKWHEVYRYKCRLDVSVCKCIM